MTKKKKGKRPVQRKRLTQSVLSQFLSRNLTILDLSLLFPSDRWVIPRWIYRMVDDLSAKGLIEKAVDFPEKLSTMWKITEGGKTYLKPKNRKKKG